jgi:hypothetical protein
MEGLKHLLFPWNTLMAKFDLSFIKVIKKPVVDTEDRIDSNILGL